MGSLATYNKKRDFSITPEPSGTKKRSKSRRSFVIQKHRASHLHYDFRLEIDGVLASWSVPKGPSFDSSVKRLAMQTEDHPLDYGGFEGTIPEGQYGGGTVMVWDSGTYEPAEPFDRAKELKFTLHGKKLSGSWVLVRTRRPGMERAWLLIKHNDERASKEHDVTLEEPYSVVSGRSLAEIAEDEGGDVEKAATGDPESLPRRAAKPKRRAKRTRKSVWQSNRAEKTPKAAAKKIVWRRA